MGHQSGGHWSANVYPAHPTSENTFKMSSHIISFISALQTVLLVIHRPYYQSPSDRYSGRSSLMTFRTAYPSTLPQFISTFHRSFLFACSTLTIFLIHASGLPVWRQVVTSCKRTFSLKDQTTQIRNHHYLSMAPPSHFLPPIPPSHVPATPQQLPHLILHLGTTITGDAQLGL